MKSVIPVIILFAVAVGARANDSTQTTSSAKKKKAAAPQAMTIPKDAVPNPDGVSYVWTDKQGKKWLYAKTPFGITRSPLSDAAVSAPDLSTTKAIDKGDTVRFERPSPFGPVIWEKKKSDLTDDERRLLDAQNAKTDQKND